MMVAWSFAIVGIHGPSGLALTALVYLVVAWSVTAWIAATLVTDVRDEPILSTTSGRPIGVRVSYNVTVPNHGYHATTPWLTSRDPKAERLSVSPSFEGFVDKPFQPGETRAVVFDLFPRILTFV